MEGNGDAFIRQKVGAYYFTLKFASSTDNSPSIYFKPKLKFGWDKLIGTNLFLRSDKDVIDVALISVSPDDSLVALGISHSGSDWKEVYVVNAKSKQLLTEKIEWIKGRIQWGRHGFFYEQYEKPSGKNEISSLVENSAVYYHKIGTKPETDIRLTAVNKNRKDFSVIAGTKFLTLFEEKEVNGKRLGVCSYMLADSVTSDTLKPFLIASNLRAGDFEVIGEKTGMFVVQTSFKAPKGRIMLYDYSKLNTGKIFLEMFNQNLLMARWLNSKLICMYMDKGDSHCYVFDSTGNMLKEITLPQGVSITGFEKVYKDSVTFYDVNSYASPAVTMRFNLNTLKSELEDEEAQISSFFQTRIVSYKSKDSTDIYMYLTYRKNLKPDTSTPVLMYAYGGYGIPTLPYYEPAYEMLMKRNAIIAIPLVRGGGEFGSDWHDAGRKKNKQNSVDDIACAARWLIDNKFSRNDKIVLMGGSQGGWLMAEAMVQFPQLFKAGVARAGLYDLLRYHLFSRTGSIGYDEFGNPEDSSEFDYLCKISPYHNIKNQVTYPSCLIMTGTHDDRVVPFHSYKLLASLQENGNPSNPYLLYLEDNAGHNLSNTNEGFQQIALMYTFIMSQLGLDVLK
jgi:prolyl oligopeptidase